MMGKKLLETRISKKIIFGITLLLFILILYFCVGFIGKTIANNRNIKMLAAGCNYMLVIDVTDAIDTITNEKLLIWDATDEELLFWNGKLDCEKQKVQVFVSEYSFENGYVKIPNNCSYGVILKKAAWKDVKPLVFNKNQVFHCLQINDFKTQQVLYKNYKKNYCDKERW